MDLSRRTLEALDWPFVAEALASHARTSAGRRIAASIGFETDLARITACFDAIDEIHALVERRIEAPPVGGIQEIAEALVRASRGETLDLTEIAEVRSTLAALTAIRDYLVRHGAAAPALARLGAPIDPDRKLCRTFAGALDDEGRLSETAWPQLGELRRRIAGLERSMRQAMERLLESAEYTDLLQDRYVTVRGDRLVLPVKAEAKSLGLGIVHDASRTERTIFVEPAAVVPLGNERRMAEAALKEEERRILAELSAQLGVHADVLSAAVEAAVLVDLACARADFAMRLGAIRPSVANEGAIELRRARHAVLALGEKPVVANDLRISRSEPVLVLTGPNAGGKTVAMKTLGLAALLVRAGCFVPAAPGSRVDLFDAVLADIGDMQTVHEGLSSFSAHLVTLREMLESAKSGTLLLLDEIAAGTDPAQGGPLARAVIERLADRGARVVATTHFTQVKAMATTDPRVEVAALEYQEGRPTYRVVAGSIGESHALAAALHAGIDSKLVERARSFMDEGERSLHDARIALEEQKTRAEAAASRAEAQEAELERREREVDAREQQLKGRAREIEKKTAAEVVGRLRAAEEEVQRALEGLREESSRERVGAARSAIANARTLAREASRDPHLSPRAPKPGDRVRVGGVGVIGEVIEVRDDEIEIRAGSMTMRAKPDEVEVIGGAAPGAAARKERRPAVAPTRDRPDWLDAAMRSSTNTLDLRGLRVEEGIEKLETFLDESMLESRDIVFVLHGHGTGAMKSAIRRALAASPYVSASCPAPEDQGGDALTVSRLRG